jgi:hypothetical protein
VIFCKVFIKKIEVLFVKTVISQKYVRYKHEILLKKDAKPNQEADLVLNDFVINVIVITEFDCSFNTAERRLRKFDLFI